MRPSTIAWIAVALGIAALLAAMHLLLPGLSRWVGGAETGLKPFEGRVVTAYAANSDDAATRAQMADDFSQAWVRRWEKPRGARLPDARVKLYLFPDQAAFSRHGLFRLGSSLEYNGGYFSRAENAIALVAGDDSGLRHELTHMLQASSWPDAELSPWFAEAQAQWHESGAEGGPGKGVAEARRMASSGELLPLREILEAPNLAFKSAGNSRYYWESAALYAWLSLERPEALERVVSLERLPGRPSAAAFAEAVGAPLDRIEADWIAWMAAPR
ncbi:MAG: hypothetical protein IT452_10045 [Planctomycetia bacterium]|nr:hypothetical protein [Planctomycetia bacterium]